jgi:hypothetical protein
MCRLHNVKFVTKEVQKLFDIFNNIQPDGLFQRSRMRGIRISQENTIGIGRLQPLVYFDFLSDIVCWTCVQVEFVEFHRGTTVSTSSKHS